MAKYEVFFLFIAFTAQFFESVHSRPLRTENRRHHHPQHQSQVDHNIFNVVDYGAIGDGNHEDTKAFADAWDSTCKSSSSKPTLYAPHGKSFVVQPITFLGKNCKSKDITIQIDGTILAPSDPHAWKCPGKKCHHWIGFQNFDGLLIHGSGTINGRGKNWWNLSCKRDKIVCGHKPIGFDISHSNNVHIDGLRFEDSPQMHIAFEWSTWIKATNLNISAPGDSPNTDGIHIQQSSNVLIHNSTIGTGDDCVSIGNGSSHLNITDISCGPGHGISIGSLGIKGKTETVEYVHVRNVTFTGTTNGVRIKTWQGGRGFARNIIFEQITSNGSDHPLIIDQYYCPHGRCKNKKSAVKISNITYSQITGTSERDTAVELKCSASSPCINITLKDINLESTIQRKKTLSSCNNVRGLSNGNVFPSVPCLHVDENL